MSPRRGHDQTERDRRVGRRIRHLRLSATSAELTRQAGLAKRMAEMGWPTWTQGRVSAVESGDQSLRLIEAADVAAAFDASPTDLLNDPIEEMMAGIIAELADAAEALPDAEALATRHLLLARLAVLTWLDEVSLDHLVSDASGLNPCGCDGCPLEAWTPTYTVGLVFYRTPWPDQAEILTLLGCRPSRLKRLERAYRAIWDSRLAQIGFQQTTMTSYGTQVLAELEALHPALSALRRER